MESPKEEKRPKAAMMSPKDVAAAMGVCVETVIFWIEKGHLYAVNAAREVGPRKRKRYRISEADLARFNASRSNHINDLPTPAAADQHRPPARPGVQNWIK